jgi:DNA polymerase V
VTLLSPEAASEALANFPVSDLWGIGHRYAALLKRINVRTAVQFIALPDDWLASQMTVNGLRLKYELLGTPCKLLELEPPVRKSFCSAVGFGQLVDNLGVLKQAMLTYLARVAERMRKQKTAASAMTIFIHTKKQRKSANGEPAKYYYNSQSIKLPHPTNATTELAEYATAALERIYKPGYLYHKVGVLLLDLVSEENRQLGLFTDHPDERAAKLSKTMDQLNARFGRDRIRLAAQGYDASWPMRQDKLSPRYTTNWKDIMTVR